MFISGIAKRTKEKKTSYDVAVRQNNKSYLISHATIHLPAYSWIEHPGILKHFSFTPFLRDPQYYHEKWKQQYPEIDFFVKGNVVHAWGDLPRELSPHFASHDDISQNEFIRWFVNYPFSSCRIENNDVFILPYTERIESLLEQTCGALDTEADGWQKEYVLEHIDRLGLHEIEQRMHTYFEDMDQARKAYVLQLNLQKKEETINACYLTTGRIGQWSFSSIPAGCTFLFSKNKQRVVGSGVLDVVDNADLVRELEVTIRNDDPYVIGGHNINGYDFDRLQTLTREKFGIGVDGSSTRHKAKVGVFSYRDLLGRIIIDGAAYSQNYYPGTIDNKLVTVAHHVLGVREDKTLDYDGVTRAHIEGRHGRSASIRQVLSYQMQDTQKSFDLTTEQLKSVVALSLLFEQEPSSICFTSKTNQGKKLWKKRDFQRSGMIPRQSLDYHETYRNLDVSAEKQNGYLEDYKNEDGLKKPRLAHNAVLLYPFPVFNALKEIVESHPSWDIIKKNLSLDVLIGIEEGFLAMPYINLREEEVDFKGRYGVDLTRNQVRDRLLAERKAIQQLISSSSVLAISDSYILIEPAGLFGVSPELQKHARIVAQGPALTFDKRSFVMQNQQTGSLLCQGNDVKGRKGERAEYHHQLYPALINALLAQDVSKATLLLESHIDSLHTRSYDRDELILYRKNTKRDYDDYSIIACRLKRVQHAIRNGLLEGDEAGYGYTLEGTATIDSFMQGGEVDIERYLTIDFGEVTAKGRTFGQGKLSPFVRALKAEKHINKLLQK